VKERGVKGWGDASAPFKGLSCGRRYRVVRAFCDFDGSEHAQGETWIFLGYNVSPHDDGLSLFVSLDDNQEWHIRLRWTPQDQAAIIDALGDYVEAVDG
jgi:hypothetical protein